MTDQARAAPRIRAILLAWLAGGGFDFLYATVNTMRQGRDFMWVWQGVASGWLGVRSATVGAYLLGVATHFGIALCMAAAYALAASRLPVLYRRWLPCGALYGVLLYVVMYWGVIPLRFGVTQSFKGWQSVQDIVVHMLIGILFSFVLSKFRTAQPSSRLSVRMS